MQWGASGVNTRPAPQVVDRRAAAGTSSQHTLEVCIRIPDSFEGIQKRWQLHEGFTPTLGLALVLLHRPIRHHEISSIFLAEK